MVRAAVDTIPPRHDGSTRAKVNAQVNLDQAAMWARQAIAG